jgi:P-type Mg2+ transporter
MVRFIMVMAPLVFFINGLTKGSWHEAFFFALAVAVGLTAHLAKITSFMPECRRYGAV